MIPSDEWLDEAKRCPVGTRRHVTHRCGSGEPMLVGQSDTAYWCKCFRCVDGGVVEKELTLEQKAAMLAADAELKQVPYGTVALPPDATEELSAACLAYLGRRGITGSRAKELGLRYSPGSNRLLICVYGGKSNTTHYGTQPRFITARLMGWTRQSTRPKHYCIGCNDVCILCEAEDNLYDDVIVLTEDQLSAWAVARITDSISCNSTSASSVVLSRCMGYGTVVVWLDGDVAGIAGAKRIKSRLSLLGKQVVSVQSEYDPKEYSQREIIHIIGEASGQQITKDSKAQRKLSSINWDTRPKEHRLRSIRYLR